MITTRQAVILLAAASIGLALLAGAAVILLSPPPSAANQPSQSIVATTVQPSGVSAASPQATLPPRQLLPPGCEPVYGSLIESPGVTIVDGETLDVVIGQTSTRVRLAGIMLSDDNLLNNASAQEIQSMIAGQPVIIALDRSEPDAQGRLAAYVFSNGWFLNQELVLRGFAQVDTSVPGQACAALFQEDQQQAQLAHAGIWQPTRVPTATFLPTVELVTTLQVPCDCITRPECSDFSSHDEAQACYNACNDYNSRLDDDRDGLACEELP